MPENIVGQEQIYLHSQSFFLVLAILFINNLVPFLYQSKRFIDNLKSIDLITLWSTKQSFVCVRKNI